MTTDSRVAEHYAGDDLLEAIRAGVETLGKSPATVTVDDLAPVDEFHIGGRAATMALCEHLGITAADEVLDIGCGIGGSSRFIASTVGCRVTGIDLTPAYVAVAEELSAWTGLEEQTRFDVGSALALPYADAAFDHVVQLHVGMNIADKDALFAELHRVLRPGGRLAVYDIMRTSSDEISYPVPWASDPSTSFVADSATYRRAMEAAGFAVTHERDRRDFAREFFTALRARSAAAGGPPPLGLHVIMGTEAPAKIANMVEAVTAGAIAPTEMIADKPRG